MLGCVKNLRKKYLCVYFLYYDKQSSFGDYKLKGCWGIGEIRKGDVNVCLVEYLAVKHAETAEWIMAVLGDRNRIRFIQERWQKLV